MKKLSAYGWVVALVCCSLMPAVADQPQIGAPAPAINLPSVNGEDVSLARYRGKPVYLDFFASWCAPCNQEAPAVGQLYAKYHARGLQTIGIDELETVAKAKAFARKYKWKFPVVIDSDGALGPTYGALGLPVHVFIDRHGNISTYRLGEMNASEIEDAIKRTI
ncbi:MAG TPA: TlpA disulfide reductase family protein [Candidatus Acidoferrales bacterium]|nr:TlpA disulfide reductase family protein [Candidatus Acidoferrales bacterium]